MSNFILYTYQHTCKAGHPAYILAKSPFKAVVRMVEGKKKIPFLGTGYYFWEENKEAAHRWGKNHYYNKYNVIEYKDLKISKSDLLDLGDRRDLAYLEEIKKPYIAKNPKFKNWRIANWIEFFREETKKDSTIFPRKFIRAEENLPDNEENNNLKKKVFFTEGVSYYTYASPLLIVCVLDTSKMDFKTKTLLK